MEDETTEESLALYHDVVREGIVFVPALWHIELMNVFLQAERRKRATVDQIDRKITTLYTDLPLQTDDGLNPYVRYKILHLARIYKLTAYDATYLELALRKKIPLVTYDADLRKAARKSGVVVL